MAWRLRLAPVKTNIDFFRLQYVTFGVSVLLSVLSIVAVFTLGLNYGIDFRGGTTIRAETTEPIDLAAWRSTLDGMNLGDVSITEVFDPAFRPDQRVAQIRIGVQEDGSVISEEVLTRVEDALRVIAPGIAFTSVESVGPKVSGELITAAFLAVGLACLGILIYVWFRFEWQFAVGTVAALLHDVIVTVGLFSVLQLRFDLTIVAALLTILGYSVNDTVVIFDRLRENLAKYKTTPLRDLMNLSANETLSRTLMTASTALIALMVLFVFGGDVIRNFIFAMMFGVVIGTYSTLYVAKNIVLFIGLDRSEKPKGGAKGQYANIDA